MGIWRTKRWHTSYSIIQRQIELGIGSVHLELCSCGLYMGCSGVTGPVPLVCFLQVNSVLAALIGEEGGAGGWRGEKTTGLAYRQGSRLEWGEKTMCTFFFLLTWLTSSKKNLHCSQTLGLWGLTFSAFQWCCLTAKSHYECSYWSPRGRPWKQICEGKKKKIEKLSKS